MIEAEVAGCVVLLLMKPERPATSPCPATGCFGKIGVYTMKGQAAGVAIGHTLPVCDPFERALTSVETVR